jgi:nucleoside-diphosphate-sugar epimerase
VNAVVRARPAAPVPGVRYHVLDLSVAWSAELLPERVDAVLHLAQSTHMREFPERALDIYAVNLASTAVLLDYARRARATHFGLASTGGLYGAHSAPIAETAALSPPRGPLGYYFDTKRGAELLAAAYADHMKVSVLRPFFIYGAGQRASMLVPRLVDNVRSGKPTRLRGADGARLNPVHVDDAVAVLEACVNAAEGRTVNVAGPEVISIRAMAERVAAVLGIEASFEREEGSADDLVADITTMKSMVSRPLTGFSTGIAAMLAGEGVASA